MTAASGPRLNARLYIYMYIYKQKKNPHLILISHSIYVPTRAVNARSATVRT